MSQKTDLCFSHTLKWIKKKKKKSSPSGILPRFYTTSHFSVQPLTTVRGLLLQRYCSSFKFQKEEVFSKVAADVSRRTSYLLGSSVHSCQRIRHPLQSRLEASGCDNLGLRVVNWLPEAQGAI